MATLRLGLDLLVPDGRELTLVFDGEERSFPLAGRPSVEEMVKLMRRERELMDALEAADIDAIETACADGIALVQEFICRLTPDAPTLTLNHLDIADLRKAFSFLAGNDSVAEEVARVVVGDGETLLDEADDAPEVDGRPLLSTTR